MSAPRSGSAAADRPATLCDPLGCGRGVAPSEFELLGEVATLYDAKRALRRVAESMGISAFALLKQVGETGVPGFEVMISNWGSDPSAALSALVREQGALREPLLHGAHPVRFHGPMLLPDHRGTLLALPAFCERARGLFLFALGEDAAPSAHGDLHLYALYLFARLTEMLRPRQQPTNLAPREIECLRWSAAGKTSSEIADIIGISENTVNSYLSAAAQKMNAVNRVQTVAQAIRMGLLG